MLRPQWAGDRWQSGVGNRGETVFTVVETGEMEVMRKSCPGGETELCEEVRREPAVSCSMRQ